MLYGACWRAARALGYRRLITYTGKHEPGVSLLASGWRVVGETKRQDVESAIKAASRQAPIGAAITLGGIPMTTAKQGKCWKCGHDDHFVNQYALAVFCNVEGCECKHDLDKLMSLAGAAAVPVAIWDEVIRTCSPCHPDVLRMLGGVRDAVAALKGEGVMGKPIEPDRPAARLCGSCWDRLCDGCQDVCINDAMREAKAMDSARRECAEMLEAFVARHGTTKFVVVPMDEFRKCIAKMERGE
jgi:hypothetical protein